jgi:hypothetical protein
MGLASIVATAATTTLTGKGGLREVIGLMKLMDMLAATFRTRGG